MTKKDFVLKIITDITGDSDMAEQIVEVLSDEGILHLDYGDKDVDGILNTFKKTFGATRSTQYDRFAAHRLAQKYGSESVIHIIKALGARIDEKYAPTPRNVANLEEKIVPVLAFLRKGMERDEII